MSFATAPSASAAKFSNSFPKRPFRKGDGFNLFALDDAPGQLRTRLRTSHGASELGLGPLIQHAPGDARRGAWRGAPDIFRNRKAGKHLDVCRELHARPVRTGTEPLRWEAWADWFDKSVDWVVREGKTGWTDLEHIGYADVKAEKGAVRTEALGANEIQAKRVGSGRAN